MKSKNARTIAANVLLAGIATGCAPPRTTLEFEPATGRVLFDSTVDRDIEGLRIVRNADGSLSIGIEKSKTSASAVVGANAELERIRFEGVTALARESITAGIKAASPAP